MALCRSGVRVIWYSAEREVELSVDGGFGGLLKITVTALLCGQDVLPASLLIRFSLVINGEPWSIQGSKKSHDMPADPPMT